jgi:hypothetical protein
MLSRRKTLIAGGATLASAIAIGGAALAGAAPGAGEAPAPSATEQALFGPTTKAVATVSPEIQGTLSIFRTRTATPVPAALVPRIASPTKYGRNAALARQIQTVTGTGYVIPGDGYVCIVVPDPVDGYGSTCSAIDDVKRRGLYIGLTEGAIPAGKHAQTVVVPDGATASVPGKSGAASKSSSTAGVISELVDVGDDIVVDVP